ncbi:MAG: rane protein [Ignavibacteria bacterium]|nr:rane protein [Ignavibacteria bacterium]
MSLIRLENGWILYGLILIPVLFILFLSYRVIAKKRLSIFGQADLIEKLMPDVSRYKPAVKFTLLMLGLAFIILGVANPQIGSKIEEAKREGVDVIIAIDVSNSMKAEDIRPNRLERAKQSVSKMIDKFLSDRIGIVVFAGDAFLQLPVTTDYSAAKLFLSNIDTDIIPTPGTAIGSAIELAVESFKTDESKRKALIILTDGENHEDDAVAAAAEARKKNIIVYTIGVGDPDGAPIPIYQNNQRSGFRKDNQDNVIMTKLDPVLLQKIASAGGGKFVRSSSYSEADLSKILDDIAKLDKTKFESKLFTDYEDRFQYFLAAALFFIVAELILSEKKNKYLTSLNLFGGKKL